MVRAPVLLVWPASMRPGFLREALVSVSFLEQDNGSTGLVG